MSDYITKARISISRKDKQSGQFTTDFSGYVSFCGSLTAGNALKLKEHDRIKLGDTDVRVVYNKEKGVTYYNFSVFSFENVNSNGDGQSHETQQDGFTPPVDDGEVDDSLPY